MDFAGALRGERNGVVKRSWKNPNTSASIHSSSFTKEYDITFSLGRPTGRLEVVDILRSSGAIPKNDDLHDYISMITINDFNEQNGQVLIRCVNRPGLANNMVRKLGELVDPVLLRCHSYANSEVPVRFNFIHPSVDIQCDVVDNFLVKYGKVKE